MHIIKVVISLMIFARVIDNYHVLLDKVQSANTLKVLSNVDCSSLFLDSLCCYNDGLFYLSGIHSACRDEVPFPIELVECFSDKQQIESHLDRRDRPAWSS